MKIFTVADNVISPLGFNTVQNYNALTEGESGIKHIEEGDIYPEAVYAAQINRNNISIGAEKDGSYTLMEKMFILSVKDVLDRVAGIDKNRLLLIISTTKGNIDLLSEAGRNGQTLQPSIMGKKVNDYFQIPNNPLIISNACISGISALLIGKRLISMGSYDHVLVTGGDTLNEFTVSGFQCLKAIADLPCKPYDAKRTGVSLGEACGTILLSNDASLNKNSDALSVLIGGGQSNDANHISGPSRTGKGLKIAIKNALRSAEIDKDAIGYICAHGTATLFNDEMEAIAFSDLGMDSIPLNSLKGYFGHTLGAAGIIESIISIRQLNKNNLLKSLGYEKPGISRDLNILEKSTDVEQLQYVLKTASGFGGCNAAVVFEKAWN